MCAFTHYAGRFATNIDPLDGSGSNIVLVTVYGELLYHGIAGKSLLHSMDSSKEDDDLLQSTSNEIGSARILVVNEEFYDLWLPNHLGRIEFFTPEADSSTGDDNAE